MMFTTLASEIIMYSSEPYLKKFPKSGLGVEEELLIYGGMPKLCATDLCIRRRSLIPMNS